MIHPPSDSQRWWRCVPVRLALAGFLTAGLVLTFGPGTHSAPPEATPNDATAAQGPADAQEALERFNVLVGEWRGVGQPRRGSRTGSWFETAEWVWDFQQKQKSPALRYEVKDGKLLKSARLTWNADEKRYHLEAEQPDKTSRAYSGRLEESGKLVLESPADQMGLSHRITITPLNEKRSLVLFEQRTGQSQYRRIAEVGYTRAGTSLAIEGAGELECVVTGGKGTIRVSYQAKTYYVCCSGCKQAFDEDPAGIIADYEKKRAQRKAAQTRK